ncbi:MAG: hypothetical protein SNJ63_00115 [Sphingomonadaceae bacterium]
MGHEIAGKGPEVAIDKRAGQLRIPARLPGAGMAEAFVARTIGVAVEDEAAARLEVEAGTPAEVTLHPAAEVAFRLAPEQERKPDQPHAGLVEVALPAAGTWRFSASHGAWIDLLGPGGHVKSAAFGNLAPCTSIRKVVEFQLEPGIYLVQLSGNPVETVRVMLSLKP